MDGVDPRALAAAALLGGYLVMCGAIWRAHRRRVDAAGRAARALDDGVVVAYASQTGHAEALARQSAQALEAAGVASRLVPLSALTEDTLRRVGRALFVVSTSGEGDAPDTARRFVHGLLPRAVPLAGLSYGVLALGDRRYADFCGFGRTLDAWLGGSGAQALFERVDVDRADPQAIDTWRGRLAELAGGVLGWTAEAPFVAWRLVRRRHLNVGSVGAPIVEIDLQPADGRVLPDWEAGDLVQVLPPGGDGMPRDYSIASLPSEGVVRLLVRLHRRPDGGEGLASGWLAHGAEEGGEVRLRVHRHDGFRLGANAGRPLILVGNGSGLAGLRAHVLAGAGRRPQWLVFGERQRAFDFHWGDEIESWRATGVLDRVDVAFSRDGSARRYVQHVLVDQAPRLRQWLAEGAAIYVCGSREGMAGGVERALREVAGDAAVDGMIEKGRLRRDVY